MNETPDMIRKEMEQTKLQLAAKLQSLEQQVSTTVHTTETAVNATIGAVQTVKGAVHNTVDSVANLLDVSRHIQKHPWLVVGSAAVVGYLAAEFFTSKTSENATGTSAAPNPTTNQPAEQSRTTPLAHTTSNTFGHPSVIANSPWYQLRDAAIGSLIGVVPQILSRTIPLVVDQLVENWSRPSKDVSPSNAEPEVLPEQQSLSNETHRLRIADPETRRSKSLN